MQRLDHSTIFVMIAGSYTPLCLLLLRARSAAWLLGLVWTGALVGAVLSWRDGRRSVIVCNVLYIALGWLVVAAGPQLLARLDGADLWLLAVGGVLFTVGAITLATRWPNPSPRVFGYHEVWHVLVVAAVVCQLIAIASVVRAADGVGV
jgi:hemolysin III